MIPIVYVVMVKFGHTDSVTVEPTRVFAERYYANKFAEEERKHLAKKEWSILEVSVVSVGYIG